MSPRTQHATALLDHRPPSWSTARDALTLGADGEELARFHGAAPSGLSPTLPRVVGEAAPTRHRVTETTVADTDDERSLLGGDVRQLLTWEEGRAPVLHEHRALAARTLAPGAWTLRWTSTLHADVRALTLARPDAHGPALGCGSLLWHLRPARTTQVLSENEPTSVVAPVPLSRWVAAVQSDDGPTTTVVLVQTGTDLLPWSRHRLDGSAEGDDAVDVVPPTPLRRGDRLTLDLVAIVVDGPADRARITALVEAATGLLGVRTAP